MGSGLIRVVSPRPTPQPERASARSLGPFGMRARSDALLCKVRQLSVGLREPSRRPFLGDGACDCGGAGAPCPICKRTDPEGPAELPAMPPGFTAKAS